MSVQDQREFVERFPWESAPQKEGFLGFLKWGRDAKIPWQLLSQRFDPWLPLVFLIQKNHEAFEWWRTTVGDQIARVYRDLAASEERWFQRDKALVEELAALRKEIAWLKRASH